MLRQDTGSARTVDAAAPRSWPAHALRRASAALVAAAVLGMAGPAAGDRGSIGVSVDRGRLGEAVRYMTVTSASSPDLVVRLVGVPSTMRAGSDAGGRIRVEVRNIGRAEAHGTEGHGRRGYMVDLVLSTDREVPARLARYSDRYQEDVLVRGGRASNTRDLHPGQSARYRIYAGIPADTPPGRYFLCARVDPGDVVRESREDNNVACAPVQIVSGGRGAGKPDLVVTRFALKRWGECRARRPVMVFEVTLTNRGSAPTPHVGRRALVGVRDQDGRNWGNGVVVPPIPPGGSRTVEIPVYYLMGDPAHMTERAPHPFRATADPLGLVDELDEGNNQSGVVRIDPRRLCAGPERIVLELVQLHVISDGDRHRGDPPGEWRVDVELRSRAGNRRATIRKQVNDGEVWRVGERLGPLPAPDGAPIRVRLRVAEGDGREGVTTAFASLRLSPARWQHLLATGELFRLRFRGVPRYRSIAAAPVEGVAVFRLVRR